MHLFIDREENFTESLRVTLQTETKIEQDSRPPVTKMMAHKNAIRKVLGISTYIISADDEIKFRPRSHFNVEFIPHESY